LKTSHHKLHVYNDFISNCPDSTQPVQQSHLNSPFQSRPESIQSSKSTFLQPSPHSLSQNPYEALSPVPTVDTSPPRTLYISVCRRCWSDFEDHGSLMAHYRSCAMQEPAGGPFGRWKALKRAFCVKPFHRRYPHIVVPEEYRQLLDGIAIPQYQHNHHYHALVQHAPESGRLLTQVLNALVQRVNILEQTLASRGIRLPVAPLPSSTEMSVTSAVERSEVLRGVEANVPLSTVDASPSGFQSEVDHLPYMPASQPRESMIAYSSGAPIPIILHGSPRTSGSHDSGVAGLESSFSQPWAESEHLQDHRMIHNFQHSQQMHRLEVSNSSQSLIPFTRCMESGYGLYVNSGNGGDDVDFGVLGDDDMRYPTAE
jgi:hypothetical protein